LGDGDRFDFHRECTDGGPAGAAHDSIGRGGEKL
jgi:hypothetical protein